LAMDELVICLAVTALLSACGKVATPAPVAATLASADNVSTAAAPVPIPTETDYLECCVRPPLGRITVGNIAQLEMLDLLAIEGVLDVGWLPDSEHLIANINNDELVEYSISDGALTYFETSSFGHLEEGLSIDDEGIQVAVIGSTGVGIWDIPSGTLEEVLDLGSALFSPSTPSQLAFLPPVHPWSPADNQAGSAPMADEILTRNDAEIAIWDSADGSQHWSDRRQVSHLAVGLHGIAYLENGAVSYDYEGRAIELQDYSSEDATLPEAQLIGFGPDGELLAVADSTGDIALWNAEDGSRVLTLEAGVPAESMVFSPGGELLAAVALDGVMFWDAQTGELVHTLSLPDMAPHILAFSPDGATLAVGMAPRVSGPLEIQLQLWGIASDTSGSTGETFAPPATDQVIYSDSAVGFSFLYPNDSILTLFEDSGNARIDLPFQTGTALQEKYLEVDNLDSDEGCSVPQDAEVQEAVIEGIKFLVQSGGDAGAGNYYDWERYTTSNGTTCVSLFFVFHSTNPNNYDQPPPVLDEPTERAVIDQILSTFVWSQ